MAERINGTAAKRLIDQAAERFNGRAAKQAHSKTVKKTSI